MIAFCSYRICDKNERRDLTLYKSKGRGCPALLRHPTVIKLSVVVSGNPLLPGDPRLILCVYPVKNINGCRPIFSIGKIYQLHFIVGNDRPQGIALIKLGDIERFIVQTNGSGKPLSRSPA